MARITEVKDEGEWERVSSHSHIAGLGKGQGFVGQDKARKAAEIVVEMVHEGKFGGRAVLIAGPPGSGKTALALGISRDLGEDVPFVPISGSEVFSSEIKKTEFLTQAFRKAIGIRVREMREIYEGEVDNLDISQDKNPLNPYQQTASAKVTLKTKKEKKTLSMDAGFTQQLMQNNIKEGDVVQIDIESGKLVKVGSTRAKDYDVKTDQIVSTPAGEVFKEKPFEYTLSLHQMDLVNARAGGGLVKMFFGGSDSEIDAELRKRIDEQVRKMVEDGKATIIPGVLFIDECSLLDIEAFAFLNRALESELAPIIIFATNRGTTTIRGTDLKGPHGMPVDLLDRLLIITTEKYSEKEIREILEVRAEKEKMELEKAAMDELTRIGTTSSLRYAIQLMAPARTLSKGKIKVSDVKKARSLFTDVKNSVNYLEKFEKDMLK